MESKFKIWNEPLIHFLLIGGLIFGADRLLIPEQKELIIVDKNNIDFLVKKREDMTLSTLSDQEVDALVTAYVDDEILYREAYRRGLNVGDTRMRHNMILKMRGLLVSEISVPTDEDLKTYYEQNRKKYSTPELVELQHLFFSESSRVPEGLLESLHNNPEKPTKGDLHRPTLGQTTLQRAKSELTDLFGIDAAKALAEADSNQWMGPFTSNQGIHFVRRERIIPPTAASYEDIEDYLIMDWEITEARKLIQIELANVRENYKIVVER
ncbi:peptidyl-prolyl cis-trans isomerase [Vibrio ulleungensis]|uniref:Peptidyl-prolyl cis-trans isomerase n=1 Tax=Vibrio ulleungensis TaxID=2807619 RepID=A0ABS2HI84_9VIBR|nr:peptidylprolyl isomerase [Vibrio ulleungensis]MBM7036744.1 peptidyl-prolyl cis-trans isomerase [Vibrio ulleungensis]